jgi:cytochrome P450
MEAERMAIAFNPMDPEFLADPYPMYHRLRTEHPVHHSPLGFWVLTRYEDVVAVLRDPRLAKEALAAFVAARFGTTVPARTRDVDAGSRSARSHPAAQPGEQGVHSARG